MSEQATISLPAQPEPVLPWYLPRKEIPLSRGRRLISKRESGAWRIAVFRCVREGRSFKWGWHEGRSPTLSLALEQAFGRPNPDEVTRQLERYLLDVVYRAATGPMP